VAEFWSARRAMAYSRSVRFRFAPGTPVTTALRQFIADDGQKWEVWDVVPSNPERRFERPPTPPDGLERRMKPQFRVNLGKAMVNGWLIFACGSRRRRLAPIPENWHLMADVELCRMLASAVAVPRSVSTRGRAADEEAT
jgi:hypothetical protein